MRLVVSVESLVPMPNLGDRRHICRGPIRCAKLQRVHSTRCTLVPRVILLVNVLVLESSIRLMHPIEVTRSASIMLLRGVATIDRSRGS